MDLMQPIETLPKVNENLLKELRKLEISTVSDLLFYFPFRYEDFSNTAKIADLKPGQQISIKATIKQIKAHPRFGRMVNRAEALVSDETGSMKVVWFNQSYLAQTFAKGDEIFLAGTVQLYKNVLQLQNPIYEKISGEQIHTGRILPIYRLTANLPLRTLRTLIYSVLEVTDKVQETLPDWLIKELGFMSLPETIRNLHFPESAEKLETAKRRIAFEEVFIVQLAVQKHRKEIQKQKAPEIKFNKHLIQEFVNNLPFKLTSEQKKSSWEILQDLEKSQPMNRLLEGDVGSGKTLVAFTAGLEVLQNNLQVILLCPTEILARQHYQSALKHFENYPQFSIILYTAKDKKINGAAQSKKLILEELAHGGPQLIIGTHATLEAQVQFKDIGLIIIDEQHRFGVRQRAALKQKTDQHNPHLLSMTATPIPRSLKLTLFGDLDVSQIKKLPAGRKPIATKLINPEERNKAYDFIRKQIKSGRQVFVVTPLIEESDSLGVKAATTESENLKNIFKEFKVGLLHGKMKGPQKEAVMQEFLDNKIQILVSTSVIEVGVDVPNASVMVIEGAERFGLAQLHQFRGRVGRSEHQSYCLLFSNDQKAEPRLKEFAKISNGFELAELDLKVRGFGNIFGEEQSGFHYFRFFSFRDHWDLAEKAKTAAKEILEKDPELSTLPEIKSKVDNKLIHLE